MRRFWRIYRLIRRLQDYKAFVSLTMTNFRVELEYWDGERKSKGDEYAAKRMLRTLEENERRGLEWAEKPYPRSGRIAESKAE